LSSGPDVSLQIAERRNGMIQHHSKPSRLEATDRKKARK
jgi:hypothetical protein